MNTKIKQISFQKEFIPLIETGLRDCNPQNHTNYKKETYLF